MKPRAWRDAIRDSELDRTAKVVAFVISTYMNDDGFAYPAKTTIARGASLGNPKYKGSSAVDAAIVRLSHGGWLSVDARRGRRGYTYTAEIPHDAEGFNDERNPRAGEGFHSAKSRADDALNPARNGRQIPRRDAGESAESAESVYSQPGKRAREHGSRHDNEVEYLND